MLEQALKTAMLAGIVASVAGAFLGALLLAGVDPMRLGRSGGGAPDQGVRLQVGTFLMAAHVAAAAALLVAPKVGSCVAAGLGAGWIGAAAGGFVLLAAAERNLAARLGAALFQAAMGAAMWAPLWTFLRVLRAHAGPTMIA